ncbi:hypothetical protein Tco_0999073 [Tanacetum coccineum]
MKQDKVKQAARDEKLVPSNARVKVGKSNLRMDPFTKQREETYQVTLDIIKNTPFFNAILILADTCEIDVDIFREILDISPKVENQEFTAPPSSESHVNFLLELGYKGKIISNDRLRLSRIEILLGMYHNENVDYAALIGEDLQYQIDHRWSKVNSREFMPYPRFTKSIIHHFMTKHKSISKREGSPCHLINEDGMLDRLKFINKGDIYQVYGKSIPDVLLTEEIKDSNAYKMFFSYSTGLIPQKRGRGRGSQDGKSAATPKEPTKPRKKPLKKKQVPHDESPESE